jgi:hypothetical protein
MKDFANLSRIHQYYNKEGKEEVEEAVKDTMRWS